jgi:hypothetical protein
MEAFMKKKLGITLLMCVLVLGAYFVIKEYKARIPVITVKQFAYNASVGDTIDTHDLIDLKVKGKYEYKCNLEYGRESCDMDDNGVLHILDNGKKAVSTIELEYVVKGSVKKSSRALVHIIVENPMNENNSYETSVSDVSFRVYNNVTDQGKGVFTCYNKPSVDYYEIVFHSVDTVNSMDELEKEIKKYAKETYLLNETDSDYKSEDVVLSSGKKARKINFSALRSEGEFVPPRESSGLCIYVTVYAFGEGDRYFFIDDNNPWYSTYEMEQIANSVT